MVPIAINGEDPCRISDDSKQTIPKPPTTFVLDFKAFFGIEPQHVDHKFTICLSDLSY
jgi:hypothetical protein